jgi:hypothetical protein
MAGFDCRLGFKTITTSMETIQEKAPQLQLKEYLKANFMDFGILKMVDQLEAAEAQMLVNAIAYYQEKREGLLFTILHELFALSSRQKHFKTQFSKFKTN